MATSSNGETGAASLASSDCPVCHGVGFVYPRLPSGKPDYSRVVPCECAKGTRGTHQADLLKYSNLGALDRMTFESAQPEGTGEGTGGFKRALEAARAFAAVPEGWLVIVGPSGTGKTHLGAAIANHRLKEGKAVLYITAADLLDHLRASFGSDSQQPYDEFFDQVRNAPLLVLDDLGVQSSTEWGREKLDQLLNHRHTRRLPTVVLSIVPLDELDDRLRTRLKDAGLCQVFELGGGKAALSPTGWPAEFRLQKSMTFESFDWKRPNLSLEDRQNLERAYQLAVEFAKNPDGWLVFQGLNGCGKTHLSAAVVNYRYQQEKPALFVVVPDFLDHLRSTFSPESKISYDDYFEGVKESPLLVLDDFGKQTTAPWAQEKLFQVVNYRYNARAPTVVTTNLSTDEMDSSISARLADPKISVFFHITAPDYWAGRPAPRRSPRPVHRETR